MATRARILADYVSGGATAAEFDYLDGVTSNIQTQLDAKVTNATHTGDVTGATALTIATDAVDIAMLSATGTADGTTFLRGDNAWAAASSSPVGVRAWLSSSVSVSDNGVVPLDSVTGEMGFNTDDALSSNKWEIPSGQGGYYLCCGKMTSGHSGTNRFIGQIYSTDDGALVTMRDEALGFEEDNSFSSITYLDAGDTTYMRNGSGGSRTFLGGAGNNEMAVFKIG